MVGTVAAFVLVVRFCFHVSFAFSRYTILRTVLVVWFAAGIRLAAVTLAWVWLRLVRFWQFVAACFWK